MAAARRPQALATPRVAGAGGLAGEKGVAGADPEGVDLLKGGAFGGKVAGALFGGAGGGGGAVAPFLLMAGGRQGIGEVGDRRARPLLRGQEPVEAGSEGRLVGRRRRLGAEQEQGEGGGQHPRDHGRSGTPREVGADRGGEAAEAVYKKRPTGGRPVMERDEAQADQREEQGFSRRGVLTGALLGATAVMLASCRGGDDDEDEGEDD